MKRTICLFTTVFIVSVISDANAQFSLQAELRPRTEMRHGYKMLPEKDAMPAFFVSQRSRLGIYYKNKTYSMGISFQDVRVWGDETVYTSTSIKGDEASVEMNQAWVQFFTGEHSLISIGRQALSYDDNRIIDASDWGQAGGYYDALLFRWTPAIGQFDACVSLNNKKENYFGNEYTDQKIKTIDFLHFKRKYSEHLSISNLALLTGYQKPYTKETIYLKGTYGAFVNYENKKTTLIASAYYQHGKNKTGQGANAYFFSIKGSYKPCKLTVTPGLDYLSGNDQSDTNDTVDHLFDLFYGTRHSVFGLMDNFTDMPVETDGGGLIDIYLLLGFQLSERAKLSLDYHYFMLQNTVCDPSYPIYDFMALDKSLGTEFDFVYTYDFSKEINLKAGYSVLLPTRSLEFLQGVKDTGFSNWAWIMLTFKPVLYSTE